MLALYPPEQNTVNKIQGHSRVIIQIRKNADNLSLQCNMNIENLD